MLFFCVPLWCTDVMFYSDKVFTCNEDISSMLYKGNFKEHKVRNYLEGLRKNKSFINFSAEVKRTVSKYSLNEYFESIFFCDVLEQINSRITNNQKRLLLFNYLLNNNIKVQLARNKNELLLFINSEESVYQLDKAIIRGRKYYDIFISSKDGGNFRLLPFKGGEKGISFKIKRLPLFMKAIYKSKTLTYIWQGHNYSFNVRFNETLISFLNDLPQLDFKDYYSYCLSETVSEDVKKHLDREIIPLLHSDSAKVRFFLSFVRTLTEYKKDVDAFGVEKPMFAEEALYYQYTDCEDRAVLFAFLIEEYVSLPYVVLKHPNHVNVALQIDGLFEKTYIHKGMIFAVCETTNLNDRLQIGECAKKDYDNKSKIIYYYNPNLD